MTKIEKIVTFSYISFSPDVQGSINCTACFEGDFDLQVHCRFNGERNFPMYYDNFEKGSTFTPPSVAQSNKTK